MKISLKHCSVKVVCKDKAVLAFTLYLIMKRNFYQSTGTTHTLFPTVKSSEAQYSTVQLNSQDLKGIL